MTNDESPSISITLSPTQVNEVVRAASQGRAPSISTLISDSLNAPLHDRSATPDASDGKPDSNSYLQFDTVDHRLSRSLLRGFAILTCFGPHGEARGIVELAEDLGMTPSTTHRYAATLVELGLLERCPKTRKYRLPGT